MGRLLWIWYVDAASVDWAEQYRQDVERIKKKLIKNDKKKGWGVGVGG